MDEIQTNKSQSTSTSVEKEKEEEEPSLKKVKTMNDNNENNNDNNDDYDDYKEAPDEEWPEAWLMNEIVIDQKKPNKQEPNVAITADELRQLGISYWKMDADTYSYPVKAIPWNPNDAIDPKLTSIRSSRGYSYADIITVHRDHLPDYDNKVKAFFDEHIHDAEEIRYILSGSGYFDIRNKDDDWVRIHIRKGDLMTLPEGIYHRFTVDEEDCIHAMRLFVGQPVWTPFNRPQEDHPSRKKFVSVFLEQEGKEEDGGKE